MSVSVSRRQRRRKKRVQKRLVVLGTCLILLIALVAFYITTLPKKALYEQYPLEYVTLAERYADEYSLECRRVLAVMLCESSFRTDAVSPAGAVGLMQIMPDTGNWIAKKLDETETYTDQSLLDADTNVRYGCWYLRYLDDRFGGDLTKSTAAYHAGPGRVDEWLSDSANSSDGSTLESIPSAATNAYVQNVLAAREMYMKLYDNAALQKAASEES